MSRLEILQAAMADALTGRGGAATWVADSAIPRDERLDVYRNNVQGALRDTLAQIYTTIEKLVGTECFTGLCVQYSDRVPSRSGDLNDYGETFAGFLATQPHLSGLPYLEDVAQLDWDCHLAYLAPDAEGFDLAALQALPVEAHAALRFRAHPSLRLRASRYPIHQIWRLCHDDCASGEIDLDAGGEQLLVGRPRDALELHALNPAEGAFLEAVLAGCALPQLCTSVTRVAPESDPGALLTAYVREGWLTGFYLEDAPAHAVCQEFL